MTRKYIYPAEWEKHLGVCLAWPHLKEEWGSNFEGAKKELADFIRALSFFNSNLNETVYLFCKNSEIRKEIEACRFQNNVVINEAHYGDIWLRDTGPIWVWDKIKKRPLARTFDFNGWGNKYLYDGDRGLSGKIARILDFPVEDSPMIMEGGSSDSNGMGVCLTTEQCLLNPNRNPGLTRSKIEAALYEILGFSRVVWLSEGLMNDHTDGHIDTLARFSEAQKVLCMIPHELHDPNRAALLKIRKDLEAENFEVIEVPSPGSVLSEGGQLLPASYMNFYISNNCVIVPVYGSKWDDQAVDSIARAFPDRKTIGLMAKNIISGGGAFHCITQQIPLFRGYE